MKHKFIKTAVLAGAAVALTIPAQATAITGTIGFAGEATLDASSATTSSEVLSWGHNSIVGGSGTFASLSTAAAVALSSPWMFNSGLLGDFWRVTDGANSYTFNLISSSVVGTTASSITVALIGTVISNVAGLSPTSFSGLFTVQDPGLNENGMYHYSESMSFGSNSTSVPDGGNTALLLGSGLLGMVLIKRKFIPRPA